MPAVLKKDLKLNVSGAIPAVLLGAGFPVQALKGVPILARTAGPDRAPVRGDQRPDRLRAVVPGDARGGVRGRSARPGFGAHAMMQVLKGLKVVEQGTFITGPGGRHAARRPGRRRDQGRDAGHRRPVPRVQGRPVQPALPDLQPQQAQHHARHQVGRRPRGVRRADRGRRRLHPELPPRRGRQARRRREAAAGAQSEARSTARSAASARPARPPTGRPTTPSRRRRAASSTCW